MQPREVAGRRAVEGRKRVFKEHAQRRVERLEYLRAPESEPAPSGSHAPARRAPVSITLVLIGAASLPACSDPQSEVVQRDLYDNRAKCVQDWGDEKKCEPIKEGRNRGYYYGPAYSWGRGGGSVAGRSD